ncbi:MAG: 30S ribosomal protein S24e [Candidatus Bathyarchaeota archaeon BA2]|nr:MAG: 30S ribosomal protein S24e [Candidatus Bathyarchaeota archaeon BA2]
MKVKISSEEYNPLLKRKEVAFEVEHRDTGGTPSRFEIKKRLASLLKIDPELVYVKKMETKTGTMIAVGEANAYDSAEQAKLVEPEHIIARNAPPEKQKEPEKPEKPEKPKEPEELGKEKEE